jgi:selenocysteine lyase/cysteine desulfurase
VTPAESTSGVVSFAKHDIGQTEIPRKLQAGKVNVRIATHWMRVSPSIYNDMADIERFLDVLS